MSSGVFLKDGAGWKIRNEDWIHFQVIRYENSRQIWAMHYGGNPDSKEFLIILEEGPAWLRMVPAETFWNALKEARKWEKENRPKTEGGSAIIEKIHAMVMSALGCPKEKEKTL